MKIQDFVLNIHSLTVHPRGWAQLISGFQCEILWHLSVKLICTAQHSHLRKSPNQTLFVSGSFSAMKEKKILKTTEQLQPFL